VVDPCVLAQVDVRRCVCDCLALSTRTVALSAQLVALKAETNEARLNLLQDFACVVVLEGTACFEWYFAGIGAVARVRAAVASDRNTTMPQREAVAPVLQATPAGRVEQSATHAATVAEEAPVESDATAGPAMSDDDHVIAEIHETVVAGRLTRNLASIRKFVARAQSRPIRLNLLYIDRFGMARS
jgi:hypothetical protein